MQVAFYKCALVIRVGARRTAIHAMRELFKYYNSEAVLLIDASNVFNSLNRAAALHNIRVFCPSIATYGINTYREPARLFIVDGQELRSSEGTRQGDPPYPDCARRLLSNFWRLEQLFAVLATSSKFCLSEQFLSKILV